jgi:hypothetical protein
MNAILLVLSKGLIFRVGAGQEQALQEKDFLCQGGREEGTASQKTLSV